MKYAIPLLAIFLIISTGFAIDHGMHSNQTMTQNQTMIKNHQYNKTINKVIITPFGTINITKQNGTTSIVINHTNIKNVLQKLRNKEKRKFIFYMLKNKTINNTIKKEIKIKILNSIKGNKTLEKEILINKTILIQFIHPHVRPIIEKAIVKNVTVLTHGNSTMINTKVIIKKKIFGIFPVNISEEILSNETSYKVKKPWWSIFAI